MVGFFLQIFKTYFRTWKYAENPFAVNMLSSCSGRSYPKLYTTQGVLVILCDSILVTYFI